MLNIRSLSSLICWAYIDACLLLHCSVWVCKSAVMIEATESMDGSDLHTMVSVVPHAH